MSAHSKVLIVFIEPTPYLLDLLEELPRQWPGTIEVLFLSKPFSQQWQLSLKPTYHILPDDIGGIVKTLYQCIFKNNYNIIFLAGWSHVICLILMFFSKWRGIPMVIDTDTPLSPQTARWKKIIKRIVYPVLFKLPTLFLPAGTRQAHYLKYYKVPESKMVLEKMTVNVEAMQRYAHQCATQPTMSLRKVCHIPEQDQVFLFVGRLIDRKGIKELIAAFAALNHTQAHLVIIGEGPLKSYVQTHLSSIQNSHYVGQLHSDHIVQWYHESNIVVLPARWEPWGLVVNEAMAMGKPVIVTNQVGCVEDLVIPYQTGLVIQDHSVAALKQAMLFFLENPTIQYHMRSSILKHIAGWTLAAEAKQICMTWQRLMTYNRGV